MTGDSLIPLVYPSDAVLLAPLAGYTDVPFRRACRRYGCHFAFTPLIEAGFLVHSRDVLSDQSLQRAPDEEWLGLQLLGSSPERLAKATQLLANSNYDLIDFNMGCPVPKVTRRNAGAALCHNPRLAMECLRAICDNTDRPVSVKIRVLDLHDSVPTVALAVKLAGLGIQALTVHGRTWQQIYSGPVATEVIRDIASELEIPVIANGGVMSTDDAEELRDRSGCSRIMVARGAIGNPWIFREIAGRRPYSPSHSELCDQVREHVQGMVEIYGEDAGMRCARKVIQAYLGGRGYRSTRRMQAGQLATLAEFTAFMGELQVDGPSLRSGSCNENTD